MSQGCVWGRILPSPQYFGQHRNRAPCPWSHSSLSSPVLCLVIWFPLCTIHTQIHQAWRRCYIVTSHHFPPSLHPSRSL
ncbi:hypothetical protein GDO81_027494 [Engystomops pustulosus]|uniref:Uncharacterized protein n=1 Tax=Engystomops pustulosus TaxID=76066 RepID=A0AAV6ZM16_ENGPU|nr:hypothetical protein GDO81_027494 [Engystomops pustulosus]